VCAGVLPLFHHGDRRVAEPLAYRGRGLEQLGEADRAGEAGGTGADEQHAHVDPLVRTGFGDVQELGVVDPRAEVAGTYGHAPSRGSGKVAWPAAGREPAGDAPKGG